ncbi:hypothetical protein RvY_12695 [Ramazzottius varieornatus]|uniref:Uncharacterized protein n=1 Tax=Ramazzottius varieornatus TaxID=947166 RepID=A0A1D1VMM8_RAMVA|nr:hypothetical protein RvY_12695 [Ramazzottius varieornatus]
MFTKLFREYSAHSSETLHEIWMSTGKQVEFSTSKPHFRTKISRAKDWKHLRLEGKKDGEDGRWIGGIMDSPSNDVDARKKHH